jgi:hypothetical protein
VGTPGNPSLWATYFPYGQPLSISPALQGLSLKHFEKLLTVRANLIKAKVRPGKVPETRGESCAGKDVTRNTHSIREALSPCSHLAPKGPEHKDIL